MPSKSIKTHFTDKEMDCGCGCEKTVSPTLLVHLEALRSQISSFLIITSGARCEAYNRQIGGASNSWHLKGLAVDIACEDSEFRAAIIRLAGQLDFFGIGIAKTFIHLDLRPPSEKRCFLYD